MPDQKPESVRMVVPMLVCRDPAAEIEFLQAAFAAVELSRRQSESGAIVHATLAIGPSLVMLHDESPHLASRAPQPDGSSSVVVYLYIDNVDQVVERAVQAGAHILLPAEDAFWGDRVARILDPAGHVWNVATRPAAT
jgi:PhnB protein